MAGETIRVSVSSDLISDSSPFRFTQRKEKKRAATCFIKDETRLQGGGAAVGIVGIVGIDPRARDKENGETATVRSSERWARDGGAMETATTRTNRKKKKTGQQRTARRGGGTMRRCDGSRLRRPSRSSIDSFIHSILQHSSAQIQIVCRTRSYRSLSCRITVPYHTIQYNTVTVRVLTMIRHSQALHAISKTCMNFIVTRSARVG